MTTNEKVARWLSRHDGNIWDTLTARHKIEYGDLADELIRLIYSEAGQ